MSEDQPSSQAVQSTSSNGGVGNPGTRVMSETLPRLSNLLSPVLHSWDVFVQQIGIPADKVSEIQKVNAYTSPSWLYTCLTEALRWWVANYHNPTYEVIIAVLDPEVGQTTPILNRTLASEVKEFMTKQGHSADLSDDFTHMNDYQIRSKFFVLLEVVKAKLQERLEAEKIKTNFRQFILDLYPGMQENYIPVSSKFVEIFEAMRANNLLSYYNYYSLEVIAKYFVGDDSELTSKMRQYKRDWSAFRHSTKIGDYFPRVRSVFLRECDKSATELQPKQRNSYFKILSVKLDECVTEYTLDYLEELWKSLSFITSLSPLYLLLESVSMGSVLVEWFIPRDKSSQVIEMAKKSTDFFRKYPILKVTIDDECVYDVKCADQENGYDSSSQTVSPSPETQSQQPLHIQPVDKGLLLKIKGETPLQFFTYAWSSSSEWPQATDWIDIADHDIGQSHIRCYQLTQEENDIQLLVTELDATATEALILINNNNSYQIDPCLALDNEKWEFPVLVITSKSGEHLMKIIAEHERNVTAKIKSPKDDPEHPLHKSVIPSRDSTPLNMVARIETMLFPTDKPPNIVSEDSGLFQVVMSECNRFETAKQNYETEKQLFTMLMDRFKGTFERDFLFYIALAYRARFVKKKEYHCRALLTFVSLCIEKFEELDAIHIIKGLNGFFEREDFAFFCNMNPGKPQQQIPPSEVKVIWFLENAFDRLMKERKEQHTCIYPTMLWITTYLSFCAMRQTNEADEKKWFDNFLKDAEHYKLDDKNIEGLKKALTLGQELKLPAELTFRTNLIGELLAPTNIKRPFCRQRDAIIALEKYFSSEEEFMEHIVLRLREAYKKSLLESGNVMAFLRTVSAGSKPQAIKDGLSLLDGMLRIITTRNWKPLQLDEDFQQWLQFILSLANPSEILQCSLVQCLQEFLSPHYSVTTKYCNFLIEQTTTSLKKLTVDNFLRVYTEWNPNSCSPQILEEYLNEYQIPRFINISLSHWKDFFRLFVQGFPNAAKQKPIQKFLMRVADHYHERDCGKSKFIVDVLKLDVPGLFSVCAESFDDVQAVTEFENKLRDFIRESGLKSTLICQTGEILDCISSTGSSFQEIVLSATLKEVITESKDLETSLSKAIDATVKKLTCDQTWIENKPSPIQTFCLKFVHACCARIFIFSNRFASIESVDWVRFNNYFCLITKLGSLYRSYTESIQKQINLDDGLPPVVEENPAALVYFKWVQRIHSMLAKWESKLQEEEANYEEIDWYFQHQHKIYKLADTIAATCLTVSKEKVAFLKERFLEFYKMLNQLILKCISGGWCSVTSILAEYGIEFPQDLHAELSVNVIFPDGSGKATAKELADIPPPIDENFNPPTSIYLQLSKYISLKSLCVLVRKITNFLAPILPHVDLLVKLHHSYLFRTHMCHALSKNPTSVQNGLTPEHLKAAVDHTQALLIKVLEGTATYGDIIAEDRLKLEKLKAEEEFSILLECQSLHRYGGAGLAGVKSLLKLIQFARPILMLEQVFKQYCVDYCLSDPKFREINEIALTMQDSEESAKITIVDAKRKWDMVHKALCLKEDASPTCLELFSKVAGSADFYHFLKEKEFTGTLGYDRFHYEVEIITQHQELDEYQETVLNHLFAAFTFISPLMNAGHKSLHSLMSAVIALDLPEGLSQLETVRKNMHLIQFWFSSSEDTPENVFSELKGILKSGCYHFETTTSAVSGRSRLQLMIKYDLSFNQEQAKKEVVKYQNRTLTTEQIDDFIHRLELLKGEDQNVQKFLCLNEVAHKLLEIFGKLQELGHPEVSQKDFAYKLQCSALLPVVMKEVSATDTVLKLWMDEVEKWTNEVENLLSSNKWLLFFRVPKLMILYEALTTNETSVSTIIQEIGFLFKRNAHTNEIFKNAVKFAIETFRHNAHSERSPFKTVRSFLDHRYLFDQAEVKKWILPIRYNKKHACLPQANNVLYNATGYTQCELARLILGVYNGPPEAFEFLHCKATTTEQELRLLMKRVIRHPRLYLIAEVNNLPNRLQEILLQLFLQLKHQQTHVYFIETGPSLLREVSHLKFIDYKEEKIPVDVNTAQSIYEEAGLPKNEDWSCIELVYGMPGNGKTHYIHNKMKNIPESHQVTIPISETFTIVSAIKRLRSLPRDAGSCAIFFNFSILPPADGADMTAKEHYQQLMQEIRWFFFELLILCYVEDPATGLSFHFPSGLSWALYAEVPSRDTCGTPADFLESFKEEIPALALMGTPVFIDPNRDYYVDDDVQLVCKYLRAYENHTIDDTYGVRGDVIKFSTDPELSAVECKRLLQKYMSDHIRETKITQKLFIQYMKRRCTFLDNLPAFNYNPGYGEYIIIDGQRQKTDTRHLGSTLMQTMLKEVADFCDPSTKEGWSQKAHQQVCTKALQLIYDFADGGGSLGLISLMPGDPNLQADEDKFTKIGVEIPSLDDLHSRAVLDKYLSRALGVPLSKDGRLSRIDERHYVLTLDFTLKMLSIHERYECGVPVVIEGETGVGKTALIEMLSELWNHCWVAEWNRSKNRIVNLMHRKMGDLGGDTVDDSQRGACTVALYKYGAGEQVTEEMWDTIAQLPDDRSESGRFYSVLNQSLLKLKGDLIFAMLNLQLNDEESLDDIFAAITEKEECSETTAHLLYIIFSATVKSVFHKQNVHANLQANEIEQFFENVSVQATELQQAYDAAERPQKLRVPFITAYLDEINTASCLGLFKEIIVDRTINGKLIPQNVFIIASCNPHRGDVLTFMHEKDHDSWLKGTYYVRKLHPTLEYLKWDYGALNQEQEKLYVNAKMNMLNQQSMSPPNDTVPSLTALIVESQQAMRNYAYEQLKLLDIPATDTRLKHSAKSCVSQRDIQRVFTVYQWLMKTYATFNPHNETYAMCCRRAVMVSLGIVYFMRLSSKYRSKYKAFLDKHDKLGGEIDFSKAYEDELEWYINMVKLPPNIAKTEALKENVFATIVCTMTRTPLIIVGDPGSSKTLSFTVVTANLKGKESIIDTFRDTDIFQSLDPHFYQCSRRTTSKEVEKTFKKAITRQHSLTRIRLPILCVVFMDEAGLPEEKLESLKVLHYYLDKQEVSFVAISNHVLDASKTNRAVSLFRPKPTTQDLYELAKVGIVPADRVPSMNEEKLIDHFCSSYGAVVCHKNFKALFGLRDFIHFVIYLRCKRKYLLTAQLILKALERNFNGSENFQDIYELFFKQIPTSISVEKIHFRSIIDILKDSIKDHATSEGDDVRESTMSEVSVTNCITSEENDVHKSTQSKDNQANHTTSDGNGIHKSIQSEVRYKLIIDPSEDDSLVRLLFTYGVLQRKETRLYICSDFPGDTQSRINTVVQIMHSVAVGHTILMCQTDEIHESFYDLFNQRFHSIKDPKHGTRYYTNIAIGAHSKLCRVHPKFQCIVVIKKSEVESTPPPFLNRFEKYYLTHQSLLETVLHKKMPPNLRILLEAVHKKAAEFISCVKQPNLYGCTKETLDSLLLTLLPSPDHKYIPLENHQSYDKSENTCTFILKVLLKMLRENAGFHIPKLLAEEVEEDAVYVFKIVLENSEFKRAIEGMTHESIAVVIDEALDVLHNGPEPTENDTLLTIELHTDALMVIAVLMQWLVCYLCKRLMQLVAPEAIPVHCGGIPTMYIRNYLVFQEHFSLKELIEQQQFQLQGNNWDRSVYPTKLLCFTRSSPLIHQLPVDHPATAAATATKSVESFIRMHIFADLNLLTICKVSLGHSQDKLEKILFLFTNSNREVLLLIVNMQQLTKKMVNHLRIMIEEAESKMGNKNKLFVLLLHFPPLMFFNPCYPSLFLHGWSHHYLDTIAHGTLTKEGVKSVVDIKRCFYHCCFSDSHSAPETDEERMLEALNELFPEAIPIIAARVAFTCESNGATVVLNASQRTELLQKIFNKNTSESDCFCDEGPRDSIAQILTVKFCKYWTLQLMVQQIDQVSRSMYSQDSTLNITDSIQSIVRSAFFDFLVYMFTIISEDHNIIDISEKDGSPILCVEQLFLDLLREIRVPELAWLRSLSHTLRPQQIHKKVKCILKFPFSKYVCEIVEKAINESREDVNQQFNITNPIAHLHPALKKTKQRKGKLFMEVVMARLKKDKLEGCLGVTVKAMDDEEGDTTFRRYFDDFVIHKLDLDSEPSDLTREIIDAYIRPLKSVCNDALSQLVSLHVCFHVHHLDLTKVTRILSEISKVEKTMATLSPSINPTAILTPGTFMEREDIKSVSQMPPTLGSFIIAMLFDFISNMDADANKSLQCWYKSYREIMSVPAMVENILSNLTSLPESQLNMMHATYLVMQYYDDLSPQRGHQFFTDLHSKWRTKAIHLHEVMDTGLSAQGEEGYYLQSFMEGLFSFFFSKHRVLFAEEDCKYFFELSNKQCTTQAIDNCLSINMLKFYITRILGEPEHGPSSQIQPVTKADQTKLLPLNSKYREMVGNVLADNSGLGSPGPYIPTFYQLKDKMHVEHFCESSKNALMQQPLAHLYFLVVFEHLQNRKYQPNHLVRLAGRIVSLLQKDSTQNTAKILLSIEKQAVVQMLINGVAAFFDPKDPSKLHSLNKGVNPILADESMGGNNTCVSWHALVLAMDLQKQLKNPWEVIQLLSDHNTLIEAFSVMKPLQSLIQPLSQPKCEIHLFPFLSDNSDLANFYKTICYTVINVSTNETNRENMDALTQLAKESYSSEHKMKLTTSYGNVLMIDQRNAFRMLLWLCVYNEFYVKKLHSSCLADTLSNELRGILEPELIGLLESFIYPPYMILPSEASLFKSFDSEQDPADIELRHSMANMVAIVLACEPRSNHLWYHLFAADTLSGSYMTGFMYPDKISENLPYDCGVELSRDGMYGRPDYVPHATRGTLSLHTLYLILWANFSAFYMALVSQPDAQEKISGPIISPRRHVHHYCMGQLRKAWFHMGDKLTLSPEEQSFFITQCMERLLEICTSHPTPLQVGRFETSGDLDTYERIWHGQIFQQSLKNIHSKFAEHCHLHKNELFQNISCLETYYPHFPTMDEFTQTIFSSTDISSIQSKLYVVSIFALEHHQLQAAGALLPDLLELYHWIHNELAYLVTYKDARSNTIEEVIERGNEKYAGLELIQLYERVRDGYNSYVEVVGHYIETGADASVKKSRETNEIKDSTKFIHFLSVENDDEQQESSDLLYLVIDDIINFHNSFLQRIFRALSCSEHSNLRKYFPEKLEENVYSTEVNDDVMIVPRKSPKDYEVEEYLQMVRSRYLQPTERTTGACPFDLHRLQIDVIQAYLVGKPLIFQTPGNRINFRFKIERLNTFALEGADLNLSVISQGIEEEFKLQLEEEYASELLCEFHSADYQLLVEVVRGLRVVTEHLKSVLIVNEVTAELELKKLPEFLLSVFKEPKTRILEDIGIKHLSPSQLACLQELKLPYLYSTLELFVSWVKDGMYDFHQLPFAMKKHLEPEDKQVLDMLDTKYEGATSALLQEIQFLTEILVKSEAHLKKTIAINMKRSIMAFLKEAEMAENCTLIPNTVLCQHYVALRVMLRRKTFDLQSRLSTKGHKQEDQRNWWVEQVEELWSARLKHLWNIAKPYDYSDRMFEFDPGTGEYGLYGYQIEAMKEQEEKSEEKVNKKKPELEAPPSSPLGKEQLEEVAEQLSVADIQEFLKNDPKLEKYTELFEENEVDGSILFGCTKESLKDLGIKSDFDRTKIISKFKKYLRAKLDQ